MLDIVKDRYFSLSCENLNLFERSDHILLLGEIGKKTLKNEVTRLEVWFAYADKTLENNIEEGIIGEYIVESH